MRRVSQRALSTAVAALLAMSQFTACDRAPAHQAADSAARSDTIVRRVVRARREPSAIQRVTQLVDVRRALEPLDSPLVVRVLDARGDELPRARLQWSVVRAGHGARLRVRNDLTDSAGLSRAEFTPGSSADTQIVRASLPGVGHIDIALLVPVARLELAPEQVTLWSGESATVSATLFDRAGTRLDGLVEWGASDTLVVRVARTDSAHARVTGGLAGTGEITSWFDRVRADTRIVVHPVTTGRIETLDGAPLPPLTLAVSADDWRDTVPVVRGAFTVRVPPHADTDVHFRVAPDGAYHAADVRVLSPRDLHRVDVVLVPTRWRIDAGTYRGRDLPIDAASAMRPVAGRAPFWRLAPLSGRGPRTLLGWRAADLPIRIAFGRSRSSESISAADSVVFWNAARQMEADIGTRLFEPATLAADPRGIVPVEIRPQASEGHTFVSWTQAGDANDGVLLFRTEATLRDPHVVTHELLHLLGFGHSLSWPTVAQPAGGTETRLTPQDVAYVQVAMRLRERRARTGARPGLPASSQ